MGNDTSNVDHIHNLLRIHRRNQSILEEQIALFTEMEAPLHKRNQRDLELVEIERLEAELRTLELQPPVAPPPDQSARPETPLPPIRVFISSTMKDLGPEREAVESALAGLDLAAVRAETVGSQSASPLEVSRMMAQQCDIYLGIYGGCYGTVVPGDGRSITEIEYHTARKLGKPILIYRKKGILVEPEQEQFLQFVGDPVTGHTWREFGPDDVPDHLAAWAQQDVQAEIERQLEQHPDWKQRRPARERLLLASLGLSPGAVTGLYYALKRAHKPVTRVMTFSLKNSDARESAAVCDDEFRRLGVPFENYLLNARDIESDADARDFKSMFDGLLQKALHGEAQVLVGITGGRTIMGALMAIVAQTTSPERVTLYHLDVDRDIEDEGRISTLRRLKHEDPGRYHELLKPSGLKCRLVQVPYVRFLSADKEADLAV
jgi:hypothetical protein